MWKDTLDSVMSNPLGFACVLMASLFVLVPLFNAVSHTLIRIFRGYPPVTRCKHCGKDSDEPKAKKEEDDE